LSERFILLWDKIFFSNKLFQSGDKYGSNELMFAHIPILNDTKCSKYGSDFDADKMMCAGIYEVTYIFELLLHALTQSNFSFVGLVLDQLTIFHICPNIEAIFYNSTIQKVNQSILRITAHAIGSLLLPICFDLKEQIKWSPL
jgi:hypothetical protein